MAKSRSSMYFTRGDRVFPDSAEFMGVKYEKVEDLRYGTNPNQGAAYYRPVNTGNLVLGAMEILKRRQGRAFADQPRGHASCAFHREIFRTSGLCGDEAPQPLGSGSQVR